MVAPAKQDRKWSYESEALKRVAQGDLCAGCGGCALVAPDKLRMEMQAPGYLRPVQSEPLDAEEEQRISAICPGLGQTIDPGDRPDDPMWGPYVAMHTGHSSDPALRFAASSGGALSAILDHLVKSGEVGAVLHNGADPDVPVANTPLVSMDLDEILTGAGSRYGPSAPLAALADLPDDDRKFGFVGKPCDIAALRALAAMDQRIADRVPVMISFFCGGVPSQTGAELVLERLGTSLSDTTAFRYRGHGWPGRATATLADGSTRSMTYHDSWGKVLSSHCQHRCKICADGAGMAADIVCADAWESDIDGYPVFEERDGTSLIVSRTSLGNRIVKDAVTSGILMTDSFDVPTLDVIQPGQTNRRRSLFARLAALRLLGRPAPVYRGLHLANVARQNGALKNLKNFLGMVRRTLRSSRS